MTFRAQITKRIRRRKLRSGETIMQTRYVLNYRDPRAGTRHQLFFERQKDAQEKYAQLAAAVEMNVHAPSAKSITIEQLIIAWLTTREDAVKPVTLNGYRQTCKLITGPLLVGGGRVRQRHAWLGEKPEQVKFLPLLGKVKLRDLTTPVIRAWHKQVAEEAGPYSANRAKMFLKAALEFGEEEYGVRAPAMPKIARGRSKPRKVVLQPEQVAQLIAAAASDPERGIYYAFPFLAGTRPSEQLALHWEDVDFERNMISIRKMQERDGSISSVTKTDAGMREVPMSSTLRRMLLDWRVRCPRLNGQLARVFPAPGVVRAWPLPREGGGGPLIYNNFRVRYWVPALKSLGLTYVTPHSARHSFISTLQAQGVEVGLVAKLAGHKNAVVTLSHYTQAMRGGEAAIEALERAFVPISA
jgi:integrase